MLLCGRGDEGRGGAARKARGAASGRARRDSADDGQRACLPRAVAPEHPQVESCCRQWLRSYGSVLRRPET
eukprot:4196348-Prymnesium_polylepis.1